MQLLAVDANESFKKAQTPLIMLVLGAVIGLGSTPLLLLALSEAFVQFLEWDKALALLASGAIGAVLAGLLLWLALSKANDVIGVFMRSRVELAENIRWIKYALTRGRRPPR